MDTALPSITRRVAVAYRQQFFCAAVKGLAKTVPDDPRQEMDRQMVVSSFSIIWTSLVVLLLEELLVLDSSFRQRSSVLVSQVRLDENDVECQDR